MRKAAVLILVLSAGILRLSADNVALSGIDSRYLAVTGEVNLYAVVTDGEGDTVTGLGPEDFILRDAPEGIGFDLESDISGFSSAGEPRNGISFLILIDDSASMYLDAGGEETDDWNRTRAAMARREALRFIEQLGTSMDRAGLAEFGTSFRILATPRTDRATLTPSLESSEEPETLEAYTELYASISEAADLMAGQKGRRIVILFSDGVNFSFAEKRGESHPEYGMKLWNASDSLEALREEAVTLYAVRFGRDRDDALGEVARSTGGLVYDVEGEDKLEGLYGSIRERVQAEYRIAYRPRPTGARTTRVNLALRSGGSPAELSYLSGFLLGRPAGFSFVLISLVALPISALLIWILFSLKAAERTAGASLGRLRPKSGESTVVALEKGMTVISPGPGGSGTVIASGDGRIDSGAPAGSAGSARKGAGNVPQGTILVEKGSDGRWRASGGDGGIVVNNRNVESTVLEDGDVIRAGEELIVFDEGRS